MTCVWCEDQELSLSLMERIITSEGKLSGEEYQKMIPDLLACYDCVVAYHKAKKSFKLTPKQIEIISCDEETRLMFFIAKIKDLDPKEDKNDLRSSASFKEILNFPYLLMRQNIYLSFTKEMNRLIDKPDDLIVCGELYCGVFFLLFSKHEKIKSWAVKWIESVDLIGNDTFHIYRNVFTAIIQVFIQVYNKKESSGEDNQENCESIIVPRHLYSNLSKCELLHIIGIVFKSMQARILKRLLMQDSNKTFFKKLLISMKDDACSLEGELALLQVLLEKLLTSFWLLPTDLVSCAEELFDIIVNHPIYKSSLQAHMKQQSTGTVYLGIDSLTRWIAPLLKSTIDIDFKNIFEKVLSFICSVVESSSRENMLFSAVAETFTTVFFDICSADLLDVFSNQATSCTDVIFLIINSDLKVLKKISKQMEHVLHELLQQSMIKQMLSKSEIKTFENLLDQVCSSKEKKIDMNLLRNTISSVINKSRIVKKEKLQDEECIGAAEQIEIAEKFTSQLAGDTFDHPIELSDSEDFEEHEPSVKNIYNIKEESIESFVQDVDSTASFVTKVTEEKKPIKTVDFSVGKDAANISRKRLLSSNEEETIDHTKFKKVKTLPNQESERQEQKKDPQLSVSNKQVANSNDANRMYRKTLSLPSTETTRIYTTNIFIKSILTWKVSSLLEGMEEELLDSRMKSVPVSFETYDDYMRTFWALLLLEVWAQIRKDWLEHQKYRSLPFGITSIEPDNIDKKAGELECTFFSDSKQLEYQFYVNDLVMIYFSKETKVFAIVKESVRNFVRTEKEDNMKVQISLRLNVKDISPALSHKQISVKRVTSLISPIRQWNGMVGFRFTNLAKDLMKPFREQTYRIEEKGVAGTDKLKLNEQQLKAFKNVLNAVQLPFTIPRVCLLQGPPGTGKSYTVKTIITHLLKNQSENSKRNDGKFRILVCAPSNAAVDQLALLLINSPPRKIGSTSETTCLGNCGDFNLIRVGRKTSINPILNEKHSLDVLASNELKRIRSNNDTRLIQETIRATLKCLDRLDIECVKLKMAKDREKSSLYEVKMTQRSKLQNKIDQLQQKLQDLSANGFNYRAEEKRIYEKILLSADIICSTLSGAGSNIMVDLFKTKVNNRMNAFSCIIIDEAGQCVEPDALIPLQYGTTKLLLVGDPAQLPATVLSKKASRFNFGQSLFERIVRAFGNNTKPAVLLEEQYRMHPEICAFPSLRFYENKLKSKINVNSRLSLPPYIVLDVLDSVEKKNINGSKYNLTEQAHILCIVEEILKGGNISSSHIGVITPYQEQRDMLRRELRARKLNTYVQTIDGYQGQEREIIILSTVLASVKRSDVGFLINPQRMNVALTRAKQSLIVLGDCRTLEVDEDWKELIDNAKMRSLYYKVRSIDDTKKIIFKSKRPFSNTSDKEKASYSKQQSIEDKVSAVRTEKSSDGGIKSTQEKSGDQTINTNLMSRKNIAEVNHNAPKDAKNNISRNKENIGKERTERDGNSKIQKSSSNSVSVINTSNTSSHPPFNQTSNLIASFKSSLNQTSKLSSTPDKLQLNQSSNSASTEAKFSMNQTSGKTPSNETSNLCSMSYKYPSNQTIKSSCTTGKTPMNDTSKSLNMPSKPQLNETSTSSSTKGEPSANNASKLSNTPSRPPMNQMPKSLNTSDKPQVNQASTSSSTDSKPSINKTSKSSCTSTSGRSSFDQTLPFATMSAKTSVNQTVNISKVSGNPSVNQASKSPNASDKHPLNQTFEKEKEELDEMANSLLEAPFTDASFPSEKNLERMREKVQPKIDSLKKYVETNANKSSHLEPVEDIETIKNKMSYLQNELAKLTKIYGNIEMQQKPITKQQSISEHDNENAAVFESITQSTHLSNQKVTQKESTVIPESNVNGDNLTRKLSERKSLSRSASESSNTTSPMIDTSPNDAVRRRALPSAAYSKFPHRHSDGLYCETHCSRYENREAKRRAMNIKSPDEPKQVANHRGSKENHYNPSSMQRKVNANADMRSKDNEESDMRSAAKEKGDMRSTVNEKGDMRSTVNEKGDLPQKLSNAIATCKPPDTNVSSNKDLSSNVSMKNGKDNNETPFNVYPNRTRSFDQAHVITNSTPLLESETPTFDLSTLVQIIKNIREIEPNAEVSEKTLTFINTQNKNKRVDLSKVLEELPINVSLYLKSYTRGFALYMLKKVNKITLQAHIQKEHVLQAIRILRESKETSNCVPNELKNVSTADLLSLLNFVAQSNDSSNDIVDVDDWRECEDITPPSSPASETASRGVNERQSTDAKYTGSIPCGVRRIEEAINSGKINTNENPKVSYKTGPLGAGFLLHNFKERILEHNDDFIVERESEFRNENRRSQRHSPQLPRQRKIKNRSTRNESPKLPTQLARKR